MADDPDILVDLTTGRTDFEAEVIVNALLAEGIEARAFTTAGAMLQWDIAATQPMRVQVRRADLTRAQAALRGLRAESVDLDWSEIDTGDDSPLMDEERRPFTHAKTLGRWRYLGWVIVAMVLVGTVVFIWMLTHR